MLKTIKKSLPASRVTKSTTRIRKERSKPKVRVHDPVEISKRLNRGNDHFIIYPTSSGYRFTFFSRLEQVDPFEILAVSPKAYKIKLDAIRAMKKLRKSIGGASSSYDYIFAFDHKGNKVSLKIEYNIKMLL